MARTDYGGSKTAPEHRDAWATPQEIFEALNHEFQFDVDLAASPHNHKVDNYLTDAFAVEWMEFGIRGWCNPPYSDINPWLEEAIENQAAGMLSVWLVPATQDVGWFKNALPFVSEVRIVTGGRIGFVHAGTGKRVSGNTKGSMFLIFDPLRIGAQKTTYVDRDTLIRQGKRVMLLNQERAA